MKIYIESRESKKYPKIKKKVVIFLSIYFDVGKIKSCGIFLSSHGLPIHNPVITALSTCTFILTQNGNLIFLPSHI